MRAKTSGVYRTIVVSAIILAFTSQARAQSAEILSPARDDYYWSCMSCHGEKAKGDGAMASIFIEPPADLTKIAKNNNFQNHLRTQQSVRSRDLANAEILGAILG